MSEPNSQAEGPTGSGESSSGQPAAAKEKYVDQLGPKLCLAPEDRDKCGIAALSGSAYCSYHLRRAVHEYEEWLRTFLHRRLGLAPPDLANEWLEHLDFRGCKLQGAKFVGSQLEGSKFDGVDLTGADFERANLTDTSWQNACLVSVNFDRAVLVRAKLRAPSRVASCRLSRCQAEAVSLGDVLVENSDLSDADFSSATLHRLCFSDSKMSGFRAVGAKMLLCGFRRTNLDGACFDKAEMWYADFSRSYSIRKASFKNTTLVSPVFSHKEEQKMKEHLEREGARLIRPICIRRAGTIPEPREDAMTAILAIAAWNDAGTDEAREASHLANVSRLKELASRRQYFRAAHRAVCSPEWWLGRSTDAMAHGALVGIVCGVVIAALIERQGSWCLPALGMLFGGLVPAFWSARNPQRNRPRESIEK